MGQFVFASESDTSSGDSQDADVSLMMQIDHSSILCENSGSDDESSCLIPANSFEIYFDKIVQEICEANNEYS